MKIKLFKVRAYSPNAEVKMIVVGFNNKVNGAYIERLGVFYVEHGARIVLLNIPRFSYWLSKGVKMKPKVSWAIGMLGQGEGEAINNLIGYNDKIF